MPDPMTPTTATEIVCAHSPDSDDAFMFYALATMKIRSRLVSFRHVLSDIETLNQKAREGVYELTAIELVVRQGIKHERVIGIGAMTDLDHRFPVVVHHESSPEPLCLHCIHTTSPVRRSA